MSDDTQQQTAAFFGEAFGGEPERMAFAPGRIEFIGNHTDYNGGLVMGVAVAEGITVAARRRGDRRIALVTDSGEPVWTSLDRLQRMGGPAAWANYPLGVTRVMRDFGMEMAAGYELAVQSTLPAGAGMSSSAAFELATARVLAALYGFETDAAGFARIGRKAENDFVGMPCGILDQGVSAFGAADHIVRIDCADESFSLVPMPEGARFWIFNSNKKHSLVDSAYADRHRECHEALAKLQAAGLSAENLSEVGESELDAAKGVLGDLLYRRASHVVGENARVREVAAALESGDLGGAGEALYASHESSRTHFENSTGELDFLVERIRREAHVYGARLTGGGFGGAVLALTDDAFSEAQADAVAADYKESFGVEASVFRTKAGDGARLL